MRYQWLKREPRSTKVIVFFGGWAIGAEAFSHLEIASDLLYISDYRDLDRELPEMRHYQSRVLVAWSFGIASYCFWQQNYVDIFDRKIAINGSVTPINRSTGIPPSTMQKTIDALSDDSFQLFVARCYGKKQPHHPIDVAARKAELIAVQNRDYTDATQTWDKVWISRYDKIFPFANIQRAWQQPLSILDGPHVPFNAWASWEEIIACP